MPDKSERRLDTLSEILECNSMCVAVACVNGKFVIASNEFHEGTKSSNKHVKLIDSIMNYFKGIAETGSIDRKIRDQLLQEIYKKRFSQKKFSLFKGKEQELPMIFKFINYNQLDLRCFKGEPKDFGYNPETRAKASIAYTEMLDIYKDIRKIEESLKNKYLNSDHDSITQEQFNAFMSYSNQCLLMQEGKKNYQREELSGKIAEYSTHAEMQLLSYLIQRKNVFTGRIYLGISKKCCIDCHCMLDAANSVLKEASLSLYIEHSKNHDGDFKSNWFYPDYFFNCLQDNRLDPIATKIAENYKSQVGDFKKVSLFSMFHSDSESEVSTESVTKQKLYLNDLKKRKAYFKEAKEFSAKIQDGKTILEHLKLLRFGIKLAKDEELWGGFYEPMNEKGIKNTGLVFIQSIKQRYQEDKYNNQFLQNFFQSPYFPSLPNKESLLLILGDILKKYQQKTSNKDESKVEDHDAILEEIYSKEDVSCHKRTLEQMECKENNEFFSKEYRFSTIDHPKKHIKFDDDGEIIKYHSGFKNKW